MMPRLRVVADAGAYADGGEVGAWAVVQDRGLPAGRPGGTHRGDQVHAGLVGAADPPSAGPGHSNTCLQVWVRHAAMARSSRSTARRAGFCTLNPSRCSRVDTA